MGMYNELNKINNSIKNQNDYIKKDAEYKNFLKDLQIQFKDLLQFELMESMHNNINIYDLDFKKNIIVQVVEDYKAQKQNNYIFAKYENDVCLYLSQNYYTIANQSRMYIKRQNDNTQAIQDDYKKQIAFEKWELQRQHEKLKIQLEAEKLKQLQQKQSNGKKSMQVQNKSFGYYLYKIIKFLLIGALAIIGGFVWMVISAATKNK